MANDRDETLKVYYYPKCGSCRNALKYLQARGRRLELRNLYEQPPTEEEIREWLRLSGLPVRAFFNTSGEAYREMKLKERLPEMDEDAQIRLLASNGRLVKRPVVTDGRKVTVGWKEETFGENWG
ncbi:Spx/MgsR family RNA polymerase-binding regulatory protein [Thermobacillus sp. ZCTH02-B1]|uniref:Spx/MgsR family RNA polymerase-binding regulatory protein n=1 Tax=Thermobacillus sp. ZCTH02-B1 TaxID=1858795 RepID=UPI0025FE3010|nr:Spx/MgsR family RNA polymerase-binding regulatory protein [Thermobacillus sp. ZCTH02-B1]